MVPTAGACTGKPHCSDAASETLFVQHSQLQRLPQELLQEILQRMQSCHWPTARLVNKQFDASLAPLITTITIRQWPTGSGSRNSSSSSKMCVSASSSLKQVRQLSAVVDDPSHLQHLLQLLAQLPHVQQLNVRGLKPLAGLCQLLFSPAAAPRPQRLAGAFPAAAAADALARLTRLDLPDSSSSSLPSKLQLPGLTSMTLFSVDSIQHLAGFAPNLQRLDCFSVMLLPAQQQQQQQQQAPGASGVGNSAQAAADALASCKTLSASLLISSSAKTAAACLAAVLPMLQQLVVLPQLQYTGPSDVQQECDEITLSGLQAVLPGLQLVKQAYQHSVRHSVAHLLITG